MVDLLVDRDTKKDEGRGADREAMLAKLDLLLFLSFLVGETARLAFLLTTLASPVAVGTSTSTSVLIIALMALCIFSAGAAAGTLV